MYKSMTVLASHKVLNNGMLHNVQNINKLYVSKEIYLIKIMR